METQMKMTNSSNKEFDIGIELTGSRLDQFLAAEFPDKTRTSLQKLIESGNVLANGKTVAKNYKLKNKDKIIIDFPNPVELNVIPQDIFLDVIYEDADILVVNKPKGMVVHPAPGNYENTLVNALLYHCGDSLSGINGVIRPGIVHRIDKNTSGLLVVAKNDFSHQALAEQIKEHSLLREYQGVVYGNVKDDTGVIKTLIGRSKNDRKRMCVTDYNAREAITHYEVITRYKDFTHMKFRLETGRTHQIRVHMAFLGHPIAGDDVYGPKKLITNLSGQCLHAKTLGFIHPSTNSWIQFDSPLPTYFTQFILKCKVK